MKPLLILLSALAIMGVAGCAGFYAAGDAGASASRGAAHQQQAPVVSL